VSSIWVSSVHNLHCPTCDNRLVELAGRFAVREHPAPVYVGHVETLTCRDGHPLPDRESLYAYRDEQGLPPKAPIQEVAPPS
jgi:hypothetical protein